MAPIEGLYIKLVYILIVCACALSLSSRAQEQVVIEAFESSGQIHFSKVSNAVSYRVEWAPGAGGPWTNFSVGAAYLDEIISPGLGVATAYVPMVYLVIATVTNPLPALPGMSLIPAGEFVMGDTFGEGWPEYELPLHTNYISAFYMDQFEVTKSLWDEVYSWASTNGYSFGSVGPGKAPNHPVHSVDWYDSIAWCNARSEREGLMPCYTNANGTVYKIASGNSFDGGCNWLANGYRLPTEAEWEKAARGGVVGQRFPWGDTISHNDANYFADPSYYYSYDVSPTLGYHPTFNDSVYPYTSPVDYFAPNGYGLYDIAGNVTEWCWDWIDKNYYSITPSTDPRGPSTSDYGNRVLRGGWWNSNPSLTRVALRISFFNPDYEYNEVGFRCARGL